MTEQFRKLILIIILCMILYIVLFPVRMGLEPLLSRNWVIPSSQISTLLPLNASDKTVPLFFGRSLFYLDEYGTHASPIADAAELSVGNDRYAQALPSGQVGIFTRSGTAIATISEAGSPYLIDKTLCILSPTGNFITVYSDSGDYRWHFEADDVISGFCVGSKGDSFVSLSDGRIFWFDSQGKIRAQVTPGHGKHHVVYGMLWIESRQELAAIVDVQPQSLLLLKPSIRKNGTAAHFELVQDIVVAQESRHPVVLQTELHDSFLVLEQPQGVGVISLNNSDRQIVPLDGTVQRIVGVPDASILVAAAEYDSGASLTGFKSDGRFLFRQRIRGRIDDLAVNQGDHLMVSSGAGVLSVNFYIR